MKNNNLKIKFFVVIVIAAFGFIMATAHPTFADSPRYRATVTFQSVKIVDTAFPNQPAELSFILGVGSQTVHLPTSGVRSFPLNENVQLAGNSGIQFTKEFVDGLNIWVSTKFRMTDGYRLKDTYIPGEERELRMDITYSPFSDKWGTTVTKRSNEKYGYFEITYRLELEQISGPTTTPLGVSIHLRDFTCDRTQDIIEGGYTGDEPYLFAAAIYFDGTTVSESKLFDMEIKTKTHGNLGRSGVDAGDSFLIPPDTGTFGTRRLYPIEFNGALKKDDTKVILLVIALEEDGTLTSSIEAGRRTFEEKVREAARNIVQEEIDHAICVESGRTDCSTLPPLAERIDAVAEPIKQAVLAKVEEAERASRNDAWLLTVGQDDYIDYSTAIFSYADLQQAGSSGLPIQMEFEKIIPAFYKTPERKVKYLISGRITGVLLGIPPKRVSPRPNLVISKPKRKQ